MFSSRTRARTARRSVPAGSRSRAIERALVGQRARRRVLLVEHVLQVPREIGGAQVVEGHRRAEGHAARLRHFLLQLRGR